MSEYTRLANILSSDMRRFWFDGIDLPYKITLETVHIDYMWPQHEYNIFLVFHITYLSNPYIASYNEYKKCYVKVELEKCIDSDIFFYLVTYNGQLFPN